MPHKDVQEKLKLSYNALEDNEKQMFLDIACFFIGADKRIATYTWKDLQLYPNSGLARMIELLLIKIDSLNLLRMHDQLRDLGRAIACSENTEPLYWSRPWDEETMKVLRRKEKNENIRALRLSERGSREFINQKSFTRMPNLKFLHLRDVGFVGDFEGSLSELRWLKLERCPDSFEATNVHLEKLVTLDLSSEPLSKNYISENWRGWSSIKMKRLKVLDLSYCSRLKSTPNLSPFTNLEMLILNYCNCLEEIHPSIVDVKRLVSLNLSMCCVLRQIPSSIEKLGELVELDLYLQVLRNCPNP
ncbi:hypothetical protein BT93_C0235 [Corymbia citriodora subsp. variegata]|nr:hypothetical protein BT93_C0235 [Corymbia citriodora subsp. variegata]